MTVTRREARVWCRHCKRYTAYTAPKPALPACLYCGLADVIKAVWR